MGCWNGTCMVSKLPIMSGEKVKLFLLFSTDLRYSSKAPSIVNKSGVCSSDDLLSPAFFPISGTYNDYGMIEDIKKDFNYEIIESVLKKDFPRLKHDGEEFDDWDLSNLLHIIERGDKYDDLENPDDCLGWDGKKWVKLNFSFVFIREDIHNFLVEKVLKRNVWEYYGKGVFKTILKKEFNKCLKVYAKKAQLLEEAKTDTSKFSELFRMDMDTEFVFKRLGNSGSSPLYNYVAYEKYLMDNATDKKKVTELMNYWLELKAMYMFMEDCRHTWTICSGSGSQDQSWELSKMLAEKIISVCDNKINEIEEY